MLVDYKKILVTYDGSAVASQAIPHARVIAERFDAPLILYRAVRDASKPIGPDDDDILEELEVESIDQRQQDWLDDARESLDRLIDGYHLDEIKVEAIIEIGHPARRVVEYATKNDVDLIIMTTHGRTGISRMIYGSVAEDVLRSAPCPTLLIRAE